MTTLDQLFTHVVFPENDGGGSLVLRINAAGAKRKRASINETLKEGIAQFLVVDKTQINIEKLFKKPA